MDPKSLKLPLRTILPIILRDQRNEYFFEGNIMMNFVSIENDGQIQMGEWSSCQGNRIISLFKLSSYRAEQRPANVNFYSTAPTILRQDEFEWLMEQVLMLGDYDSLIQKANAGLHPEIIILNHICLMADYMKREPGWIFHTIKEFNYNPEELMKKLWVGKEQPVAA